jgi:hypothetical protein
MGVFAQMMEGLASEGTERKTVMIDATYLKAHRTASSLRAKKGGPTISAGGWPGARRARCSIGWSSTANLRPSASTTSASSRLCRGKSSWDGCLILTELSVDQILERTQIPFFS